MSYLSIRKGNIQDLDRVSDIEYEAFPPGEAASRSSYQWRIENIGEDFFVAQLDNDIVGFIFSRRTELKVFVDDLYESFDMKEGSYLAILTVATDRKYQRLGVAAELIQYALKVAKAEGLKGATLACKDNLVHYYSKFGFYLVGESSSLHGGVSWNDMRIEF